MSKSRVFFRVIVGGYLAYLGVGLIRDAFTRRPEHYVLYIGIGAIFALIGLWWFARAAGAIIRHDYIDPGAGPADDEDDIVESGAEEKTEVTGQESAAGEKEPDTDEKESVIEDGQSEKNT